MSVGRELFGAERQRAIDLHLLWLMAGRQFEREINDDAPIARFARSPQRRVSFGKRIRRESARLIAWRKQCG